MLRPTPEAAVLIAWLENEPDQKATGEKARRELGLSLRGLTRAVAAARAHDYIEIEKTGRRGKIRVRLTDKARRALARVDETALQS